jgi:hypothetical protein
MGLKILLGEAQLSIKRTCYNIGLCIYVGLKTLPLCVGGGLAMTRGRTRSRTKEGKDTMTALC